MLSLASVLALTLCAQRTIVIVPLGKVDAAYIEAAKVALEARIDAEVRVAEPSAVPEAAYYAPRKRYRAEKILDALDATPVEAAWKVLAITAVEISTTKGDVHDWGIAGLGNINGQSAVASTFLYTKYSKTKALAVKRFADVAVHEFGHTIGLEHCPVAGCVMSDAKGKAMSSADASSGQYCSECRHKVVEGVLRPAGSGVFTAPPPPK